MRRWSAALPTYRALTPSQVKTGKYFIVVALVFLASQGAGAIMAHSYYERETFYGVQLNYILPFNFLRSFHLQAPIIWIGLGWIASGLFIAPAIAGGREAKGPGLARRPPVLGLAVRRRGRAASAITSASRA